MRKEDIPSEEDGYNEQHSAGEHQKDSHGEKEGKKNRQGGMDVFQPNHRNIPENEDDEKEDQAGNDEKPDKNPLPGLIFQLPDLLSEDGACRDVVTCQKFTDTHFSLSFQLDLFDQE